jgi:pyrroloquinoline quinone (PQQ) biosynthesis protein C
MLDRYDGTPEHAGMRDLTGIDRGEDSTSPDRATRPAARRPRVTAGPGQSRALSTPQFRERLLAVMDQKNHWAWPEFSGADVGPAQLRIHFQQEFATYVRDFAVLLARILARNPPPAVRRMLAENIYEEETGALSFGKSHPELFLTMMQGLGLATSDFEVIRLLPEARAYRAWLDRVTGSPDWVRAAATMAIFVEGSVHDRHEILHPGAPKTTREIEQAVLSHPLVRYHGVSPACMDLTRAHQKVEGGHRQHAYAMVVAGATGRRHQQAVIDCVEKTLAIWLRYRDAVARACGLTR